MIEIIGQSFSEESTVIEFKDGGNNHRLISVDGNGNQIDSIDIRTRPKKVQDKKLVTLSGFEYVGGFKVPNNTFGSSRAGYSIGQIALGQNRDTIFLAGHTTQKSIAEFSIPALVNTGEWKELPVSANVQTFTTIINRTSSATTQNMDRIGGMCVVDGKLIVNVFEYYDGPADNTFTTVVFDNAADIANCNVIGFHGYDARAHAAGWISKIPDELQVEFGGTHIAGDSSGRPIISRNSVGPSAFAFNAADIASATTPTTIPTTKLLDFSLKHPMGIPSGRIIERYLSNLDNDNYMWTHVSGASFGFIIPGTNTYAAFGGSGGHTSYVGYKINRADGTLCGGYCAYEPSDNYGYYWLFDLDDMRKVVAGEIESWEVLPYEYGKFDVALNDIGPKKIIGGCYDDISGLLYLVVNKTGYEPIPAILAYKIKS